MNEYMAQQLRVLETFISETGRETGQVSGAMAAQALEILRGEVERAGDLSDALSARAVEVREQAVPALETSALRQYVTVVEMAARHVVIPSLDGIGQIRLDARPPETGNVDEMILFGYGSGPLGIMNAYATVFVNQFWDRLCPCDLGSMACHVSPVAYVRWIASLHLVDDLAGMMDDSGNRLFGEGAPASMLGFPIIWMDGEMCQKHGFSIALADLRYYVWGEYKDGDSLLVDGTIGTGPFANADGSSVRSPFIVLRRGG